MLQNEVAVSKSVETPRKGLKNKLILIMIGVGTLPLLLAMMISYVQGTNSLQNVIGASFQALAAETAMKIDFMLNQEIEKNRRLATHPTLILTVREHDRSTQNMTDAEIGSHFKKQEETWLKKDSETKGLLTNSSSRALQSFLKRQSLSVIATHALFVTDPKGVLIASINSYPDFFNGAFPFVSKVISKGKDFVYIGPLKPLPDSDKYGLHLAVPILNHSEEIIGIFHRVYLAKEFFASSIEPILFGETGHVMLIDSRGMVIDCPILPTGMQLSDPELVKSVTGPHANWVLTEGDGHGGKDLSIIGYAPLPESNKITLASADLKWFTFAWQSSSEVFAPTEKLFLWISAAGFFSILLIALMGSLASNKVVNPIRLLQDTTARIGRGEDVEPLEIPTGDEIESLANEINLMNRMLKKSFSGLEDQVREKTKEVRSLQEFTEGILMSVPDILLIFNEDLKAEYVNAAFEKLTEIPAQEILGNTLNEMNFQHQDRWDFMANELRTYVQGLAEKPLPSNRVTLGKQEPRDPLAPQPAGPTWEAKNTVALGDRMFAYQFFDVVITVEEKRRIGILMKEISEEKALQDQLAMAEKLSGLGTLAAGIAHEMNNPLYSIMGFTEAIIEEKDPAKIKTFAEKVLDRAKHMASIILNMSGYSRSGEKDEARDVNINERLDASIEMALLDSYSDDIQLEKQYSQLPLLKAKPEEIQQIYLNIIRNAVQAMEGKGKLVISSAPENGQIVTRVQDNGPGIPQEYLSKIFDPFFTTKEQGEGTGLGLNIVHKLIEKYGGSISVETKVGEGTTFIIAFPSEGSSN